VRLQRAEALRYRAREVLDRFVPGSTPIAIEALDAAEADLRRATTLAPAHGGAWADLAHAVEIRAALAPALVPDLAAIAADTAERAVARSEVVPEFWIRLGIARDMQGRPDEAARAFEKAVSLAPRHPHVWYYYAYHLSFATNRRDDALRAIATCLSLDPGNAAGEALRVKLNDRMPGAPLVP
jgi:tetratricopeptide (TPR) repeat protein